MALGIFSLLEVMLIFVNAIAILNEDRFLAKSKYRSRPLLPLLLSPFLQPHLPGHRTPLSSSAQDLSHFPSCFSTYDI